MSNNKGLSAKEREILERQRSLAARFKPSGGGDGAAAGGGGGALTHRSGSLAASRASSTKPSTSAAARRPSASINNNRSRPQLPGFADRPPKKPAPPPKPAAASKSANNNSSSVIDLTGNKPAAAAASVAGHKRPSNSSAVASLPPQKRPSKRRSKSALLVDAAAAAATKKQSTATKQDEQKPSPKLQRKTLRNESGASSLAKLVQHVAANNPDSNNTSETAAAAAATLPSIQPDDYWKHLRDWDFVSQLANEMKDQQRQQQSSSSQQMNNNKSSKQQSSTTSSNNDTTAQDTDDAVDNPVIGAKKPLPNVFLNPRHYMAAWAPLCLAECRAQILQEAGANNGRRLTNPILVTTESTNSRVRGHGNKRNAGKNGAMNNMMMDAPWMAENETGGHILVHPKQSTGNNPADRSFMTGELCLLIDKHHPTILRDILRGVARPPAPRHGQAPMDEDDPHAYRSVALIGHTETTRNDWTRGGLVLKVSKRKWAVLGQKEMLLVRLGSNVTALREFTALCRMDTLPLQRYLLGLHLEHDTNRRKLSAKQPTDQMMQVLGGAQQLGKGFVQYCQTKFNASQLTAIAASAHQYGEGGFTLIKGPPGTGKTTTLVAILNSLHIRQYNKYYQEVRRIAAQKTGSRRVALELAHKAKPRLLVCAPSNAAVDNIILKIMQDGFVDGQGNRYNPSMIRVGVGQSDAVRAVSLSTKVDEILNEVDHGRLVSSEAGYRMELSRITTDITNLRRRLHAIQDASPYPLSKDWEIRVDEETFNETGRVYFVNHRDKETTYEVPPPPEPGETHFPSTSMPEYREYLQRIVKLVENFFAIKKNLDRCSIIKNAMDNGANTVSLRMDLETHALNSVHIVLTTLGTAGNRTLDAADKFEVVVVDEAAQSVEPGILSALQLGNRHAVLVGDPQQLPATIFNVSGRNSKYDRSLFQRLEEAGQPVYMLNEQYRMHPKISHFPRHIFYSSRLLDGPNVRQRDYGDPLRGILCRSVPNFQPFTILDLDSKEERGGTSLANTSEAKLAVHLFQQLKVATRGLSNSSRVAIITPYAQQSKLLRNMFMDHLGPKYEESVEVNTVDAFQGREANIVIFSAVRAAGSHGVGFLADVRRMNVALTRAKHFLFVIARCESIVVNPYWRDLVQHARETKAVVKVPMMEHHGFQEPDFGDLASWPLEQPLEGFSSSEQQQPTARAPAPARVDPRKPKPS